ncbi:hypothetical protein I6N91_15965 [Arthrobacter sp. MSA 4-2]|uniref:hypothetical protein n=1 Tax=Arthrobacter sp. MSA 4-2 TaxID=2794349 RepID=UPI0018E880E6|nr:hypothetical protein [Arthrobacter sp. MSA 4-2]MBJ2122477.1 hypothetical protein [Arthrobacter sp. MSA 4-2]
MRDVNAGAEVRWAKAAARAEGVTDLGIGAAVRRYFLVVFPSIIAVALVLGFVLAAVWTGPEQNLLRSGIHLGLLLAGIALLIIGLIYGNKKVGPLVQPRRMGVMVGLTADEAKHVRRQVLTGKPTDPEKLTVLRGAAVQIREGLAKQLLTTPGSLALLCGQAVSRGITSVLDVVMVLLLLALTVLLGFIARQFQRTGTFLSSTRF